MTIPSTPIKKTKAGCCLIYIVGIIIVLYAAQWLFQIIFYGTDPDEIALALRPYQNHYFSFSKYFITTEGAAGEFTDDITGIGRMIGPCMIGFIIWLLVAIPMTLIKPLKKIGGYVILLVTLVILVAAAYTAFFAPPRKTTFNENEVTVEYTDDILLTFHYPVEPTVHLKFADIERFEFDFMTPKHKHFDQFYVQFFMVVDSKRFLIGENQVTPDDKTYTPNEAQKIEAQKIVDVLTKLIEK
jgi:hypothetical protein